MAINKQDEVQRAYELFKDCMPANAELTIEVTHSKLLMPYIFRMVYTNPKNGHQLCMMAKGESLPTVHDYHFHYYATQLIMPPKELAREFSRRSFMIRSAKQNEFLFGTSNNRVYGRSIKENSEDGAPADDLMPFEEYV